VRLATSGPWPEGWGREPGTPVKDALRADRMWNVMSPADREQITEAKIWGAEGGSLDDWPLELPKLSDEQEEHCIKWRLKWLDTGKI
jgi:hypothetical protein